MSGIMKEKIVLAFSGGLDKSFCVPYLIEQNYDVYTIFVDSGGTPELEILAIKNRALVQARGPKCMFSLLLKIIVFHTFET